MLRADRYEQRQYSKYLEREHAPQHTLHDALLRIRKRKGGKANGNNAKKRPRDAPKDEACSKCGSYGLQVIAGDAMRVKELEVE